MDLSILVLIIVTISNAALGALVFLHRPKAIVNRLFALTALTAGVWTGTNALFQTTNSVAVAMATAEASSAASVLMGASFLHFSWTYPLQTRAKTIRISLLWGTALLLCLLSLVPGAVDKSVEITGTRRIVTGPGFYLVATFLFVTAVAAFYSFIRHTRTLHGTLRNQALYVVSGTGVTAFFAIIFNLGFPLFGDYRFVWLGPSFSVFFVGGTVYSIIAHHLFDIRLIIKRTVLYSLLLACISAGYSAIEYILTEVINSASPGATPSLATNIAGAVIVSLCVHPVRKWLEHKIHRFLYPHEAKRSPLHADRAAIRGSLSATKSRRGDKAD